MEQQSTTKHLVKIKKLPSSRIVIEASISGDLFDSYRSEAIKHIGAEVTLPGFRKGHVPEKVLLGRIGEGALLEEMAEIAISKAYPKIIVDEKLDVLGRPEISITKIAHGNLLEFTITTAVFPEFTLPDYKKLAGKIANKKEGVVVTDDDLTTTLEQIRRMQRAQLAQASGVEVDEAEALPEITDTFVATLGDFKTVEEFKVKLRENILVEKTRAEKDKKRVAIMEAIIKETPMELPEVIVEQELLRMQDEFGADVARMGLDFEQYLKTVKKTKEELHNEWKPDAAKRAKIQILIGKIADQEKIEPDEALINRDTEALQARYPETDKERVRSYIHMLLTNEKVFEFLEATA